MLFLRIGAGHILLLLTVCFVMSDGSDTCLKSITLYNELILNELRRKVILLQKSNIKK